MKWNMKNHCILSMTAVTLVAAGSANAAIQVTFDAADSNIATGHYDFDLTGLTAVPTYNSTFELLDLSLIGNTQSPMGEVSSPSGWVSGSANIDLTEWYFQNTSGSYNGFFDITATSNLKGTIDWNLAVPGGTSDNGTVYIGAAPESPATGMFMGCGALTPIGLAFLKRKFAIQA